MNTFYNDCTVIHIDAKVTVQNLYDAYKAWCGLLRTKPCSRNEFSKQVSTRFRKRHKYFEGIRLKFGKESEAENDFSIGDMIICFYRECCIVNFGLFVTTKELHAAYLSWCARKQYCLILNHQNFSERVSLCFGKPKRKGWEGLGLIKPGGEK